MGSVLASFTDATADRARGRRVRRRRALVGSVGAANRRPPHKRRRRRRRRSMPRLGKRQAAPFITRSATADARLIFMTTSGTASGAVAAVAAISPHRGALGLLVVLLVELTTPGAAIKAVWRARARSRARSRGCFCTSPRADLGGGSVILSIPDEGRCSGVGGRLRRPRGRGGGGRRGGWRWCARLS